MNHLRYTSIHLFHLEKTQILQIPKGLCGFRTNLGTAIIILRRLEDALEEVIQEEGNKKNYGVSGRYIGSERILIL